MNLFEKFVNNLYERTFTKSVSQPVDVSGTLDLSHGQLWELVSKVRNIQSNRKAQFMEYRDMLNHPIIGAACEMWADDATQRDPRTNQIVWVDSKRATLKKELETFLYEIINIDSRIWTWAYNIGLYGGIALRTFYTEGANEKGTKYSVKPFDMYFEEVPDYIAVSHLMRRGKTQGFFYETEKERTVYPPMEFIHFCSDRFMQRNRITLETEKGEEDFMVKYGSSMLEQSRQIFRVLKMLEDILILTRVSRSASLRMVQVNVGTAGREETLEIVNEIKRAMKCKEMMDLRNGLYRSDNNPVPINDSIYVPTRNGKGEVQVSNVGGDTNIKDIVDIDYFRNQLFGALRIPKGFLGFEEFTPGGIGNSSLTRLDIRYARTIKRIDTVLRNGIKDMCNYYLQVTGREGLMGQFEIQMAPVSSAEEGDRVNDMQNRVQVAEQLISMLVPNFEEILDKEKICALIFTLLLDMDYKDLKKPQEDIDQAKEEGPPKEPEEEEVPDEEEEVPEANPPELEAPEKEGKKKKSAPKKEEK